MTAPKARVWSQNSEWRVHWLHRECNIHVPSASRTRIGMKSELWLNYRGTMISSDDEVPKEREGLWHRDERLNSVPVDFPWHPMAVSLSGSQPKLAGRMIDGKFVVGLTAEERWVRWDMCEDLAHQLVPKALKDAAKFPDHSHETTLQRVRRAIEAKSWTEGLETDWLIERLRTLLAW